MKTNLIIISLIYSFIGFSQKTKKDSIPEITVTSNRIELPFSKNSRTIEVINNERIKNSTASTVTDLLQNVSGIDIRRRGVNGMQADIYIRGGNFEQVLVLIDGVKMEDAQTGHHTLNAILDLDNIERIEIIKGPAARIYGQKAFTGAVNIITKKIKKSSLKVNAGYGAYENKKGAILITHKKEDFSVLANVSYQESNGYRFNTDFENQSAFLKTNYKGYKVTSSFTKRKFGANGFYASPAFTDQYEETQTSLVALNKNFTTNKLNIKPRMYWRRNQDMYLFLRQDPAYYRNLHISNKVGTETNFTYNSKVGKSGIGIDVARTFLVSNNLNDHQRTEINGYLEQRIELLNGKLDITPGIAFSYYSDFNKHAFPGMDIGYRVNKNFKIYGNVGYTYRVPTFTDLYYVGPTTLGNPDLKPESALGREIGFKYTDNNVQFNVSLFNRYSKNLIDFTKENEADKWQAQNFSKIVTNGLEVTTNYVHKLANYTQKINIGYTYMEDDIKDVAVNFTRYSLNSFKHQVTVSLETQFVKYIKQSISYRYVQRTNGYDYPIFDAKVFGNVTHKLGYNITFNNIFNTEYTETNAVPMPKGNWMAGLRYTIY